MLLSLERILFLTALAFVLAVVCTGLVLFFARRFPLLDHRNERSMHKIPTPRSGGIGILCGLFPALILGLYWQKPEQLGEAKIQAVLGGTLLMAVVGLLDDLYHLSAKLRLLLQFAAAWAVAWAGLLFTRIDIPFYGILEIQPVVGMGLTVLWLVTVTNFFNFMDGMDGIAGSEAGLNGAFFILFGLAVSNPWLVAVGVALLGSCFGFLVFNWSPARIFMGDVGSASLGFLLAASALFGVQESANLSPWIFALLLGPFLFDAGVTVIRRALRGENILKAHREHFYQRADVLGFRHATIVSVEMGLTLLCGLGAFGYVCFQDAGKVGILLTLAVLFATIALRLTKRENARRP